MKSTGLGFLLLLLGGAGCAVQAPPAQQVSETAAPLTVVEEKPAEVTIAPAANRNCRRESVTGTRFKRNRCISAKERQRMRDEAGEIMDRASPGGPNVGAGG